MRTYEILFIVRPDLPEEELPGVVETLKSVITAADGTVDKVDLWGKRRLAYKVSRYPRELVEYLRAHGRRKVLFGSNHPAWPPATCLEDFESLGLDAEAEELFLYRNAERVFALGG